MRRVTLLVPRLVVDLALDVVLGAPDDKVPNTAPAWFPPDYTPPYDRKLFAGSD